MTRRILVTGSRRLTDRDLVQDVLRDIEEQLYREGDTFVLVVGDAKGADEIAASIAEEMGWAVEVHVADWTQGRGAGHMRNADMVALGAEVCLGFPAPGAKGTWDCLRRACDARIPVRVYGGRI